VDSIGAKLRYAREAKRLTIKDVVKESKISYTYIEALEEENFEKFPSETYLIGFLRSYSEYLKLNPVEMVNAYKGFKIGESDTPVEELTKSTQNIFTSFLERYKNVLAIFIVTLGLILFVAIIALFFSDNITIGDNSVVSTIKDKDNKKNTSDERQKTTIMQIQGNRGMEIVRRNEAISFLVDNNEVVIILKDIGNKEAIIEILPGNKTVVLEMKKQEMVQLDKVVRPIGITLRATARNSVKLAISLGAAPNQPRAEQPTIEDKIIVTGIDSTSVMVQNPRNLRIILEADFRQRSYLELYLDANKRFGGYIREGRREVWEANQSIQLRLGNAGGVDVKINGRAYRLGSPGQVVNKTITWRKDADNPNLYHIVVKDSH
jgi:cytoskeletal protein RodZ